MKDAALIACPLSTWAGDPRRCRWCDGELPPRRQRWCSDECASEMLRNHYWGAASNAAKRRDGYRCQDCGAPGHSAHHETPLHTLQITVQNWERIIGRFVTETRRVRHGDSGCWHHQDGLVTLCDPCHGKRHRKVRPPAFDQLSFLERVRAA